ncbi:hypothetical protein BCV70DRAFT_158916 [Testicularia cyperi]|uniref:Velvet domain-containing protein n=1 Tax=Testicularia cyperi TaxID=1882483 RepID=A0A317XSR9_9BASI|nr:hypothetical protein BCV70DRAFT_158916 [Testicularia cyperi]
MTTDSSNHRRYELRIVQQPTIGSAFHENLFSRIGLAPPLIVELKVLSDDNAEVEAFDELPFLLCQCSLVDESGRSADMVIPPTPSAPASAENRPTGPVSAPAASTSRRGRTSASGVRRRASRNSGSGTITATADANKTPGRSTPSSASSTTPTSATPAGVAPSLPDTPPTLTDASPNRLVRMLYGTIVASPQPFESPEGDVRPFFFFPEISIRAPGRFKLQCSLIRLSLPGLPSFGESAPDSGPLATAETETFEVVERQTYVAPYITEVSRHFARQGVPLLLPPGATAD